MANYLGKLARLGSSFLLAPFVLQHLGASNFGLLVLANSVIAFGALLHLGLANTVTKYVAEYTARGDIDGAHTFVATILRLHTGLGLIAVVACAAFAPIFSTAFAVQTDQQPTARWLFTLLGVQLGLSLPGASSAAVLRGLHRFDLVNLVDLFGTLVSSASVVAVLTLGGDVVVLVLAGLPGQVGVQLLNVACIRRSAPALRFGWSGASRSMARQAASFSSWLMVSEVGGRFHSNADEIVIGANRPLAAVTPYALAHRLSDLAEIIAEQYLQTLLPLASELHAREDQHSLQQLYMQSLRLTLAIFVPIACALIVLADTILLVWVGPAYDEAAPLLVVLVTAGLIGIASWPAGLILQGMARHRTLATSTLVSGLTNVALSFLLLPVFGLLGVALATLISVGVETVGFVLPYAAHTLGVNFRVVLRQSVLPVLAPGLAMALALVGLRAAVRPGSLLALLMVLTAGGVVYLTIYLMVGAPGSEREAVRSKAIGSYGWASAWLKGVLFGGSHPNH